MKFVVLELAHTINNEGGPATFCGEPVPDGWPLHDILGLIMLRKLTGVRNCKRCLP